MNFGQSISTWFGKYANFKGRAIRSEYLYVSKSKVKKVLKRCDQTKSAFKKIGHCGVGWICSIQ